MLSFYKKIFIHLHSALPSSTEAETLRRIMHCSGNLGASSTRAAGCYISMHFILTGVLLELNLWCSFALFALEWCVVEGVGMVGLKAGQESQGVGKPLLAQHPETSVALRVPQELKSCREDTVSITVPWFFSAATRNGVHQCELS